MAKKSSCGPVWVFPVVFLVIAIIINIGDGSKEKNKRQDPFPITIKAARMVCAANNCMQQIEAESVSSHSTYELHKYHEPWVSVGEDAYAIRVYDPSVKIPSRVMAPQPSPYHYELYEENE